MFYIYPLPQSVCSNYTCVTDERGGDVTSLQSSTSSGHTLHHTPQHATPHYHLPAVCTPHSLLLHLSHRSNNNNASVSRDNGRRRLSFKTCLGIVVISQCITIVSKMINLNGSFFYVRTFISLKI